ncbi:MAG: PKD domain-containing protein [Bacteroidota bacterium]
MKQKALNTPFFGFALWTILLCILSLAPSRLSATHIVGGEVTYTCLGQNADGSSNFEVQMTIFRDCFNGNPNAFFDQPASIGIFDQNNNLLTNLGTNGQLLIPFDTLLNDTLDPVLSNPCLVVPPTVCVHTTFYLDTITLPFRQGGYLLAYQRCCRNRTILNIVNPLASGATFSVRITEQALNECNSSAKFTEWPPIYICSFEPIDFDQGAIDPDGDSIVYKLCTPLLGADQVNPRPQPPNNPPYDSVVWNSPPYGLSNMLNSDPSTGEVLRINPETGFLTGIPNTVGQFVVGICLEEYRDGSLISTTRRDFQYNVGLCNKTVSSFFAPLIQCDSLTVSFENQSENANSYEWYFNDPGQPGLVSSDPNPTFTFSDTGRYTVMLIADPNTVCVDTSFREVYLQFPSLTPEFNFQFVECSDSMVIEVTDLTTDSISEVTRLDWVMTSGFDTLAVSNERNPTFVVQTSQLVNIQLTAFAANGCIKTFEQQFFVSLIELELPADTLQICIGDSVELNPNPNLFFNYNWTPGLSLNDSTIANPTAQPGNSTLYAVEITDNVGFCRIRRQVMVEVPPPILPVIPPDTAICAPAIVLTASSLESVDYLWSSVPDFSDTLGQDPMLEVAPVGPQTFYIQMTDAFGCFESGQVTIEGNSINTQPDSVPLLCLGQSVTLQVLNLDPNDTLTYNWSPGIYIASGADTSNPQVEPSVPGTIDFTVEMSNQFGCERIDTVPVNVLDTLPQEGFVVEQQCGSFQVQFINTGVNAPFYTWHFGDPNQPNATSNELNPTYTYSEAGTYVVFLTADADCADTVFKEISLTVPQIELDFNWDYEECGDSIVLQFNDLSTNSQSNFTSWEWFFNNDSSSTVQNPQLIIRENIDLEATLIIESDDGCIDTLTQPVPIRLIEVNILDSLTICPGDAAFLNPGADTSLVYQWFPADGLDDPNSPNPQASPVESTTYSVQVSSFEPDTCQVSRQIFVQVPPVFDVSIPISQSSCDDSISITAIHDQPLQFLWSESILFDSIIAEGSTVVFYPDRQTDYFLRAVDSFGCVQERSTVLSNLSPQIAVMDQSFCRGDTIRLSVENLLGEDPDPFVYQWEGLDEVVVPQADVAMPEVFIPDGISSASFAVTVTNQFDCVAADTLQVSILGDVPFLTVSPLIDTIFVGRTSSVQLLATEDPGYTYSWLPSESLSDPSIFNPIASPTETTDYFLEISDENGCPNRATLRIIVLDPSCIEPNLFVPNAFTPNADGENDDFRVYGNFIEEMHLIIYNRWGQKVFESRSQDNFWDGTLNGQPLSAEAYGYYLMVRCVGGDEFVRKGNVTILR